MINEVFSLNGFSEYGAIHKIFLICFSNDGMIMPVKSHCTVLVQWLFMPGLMKIN